MTEQTAPVPPLPVEKSSFLTRKRVAVVAAVAIVAAVAATIARSEAFASREEQDETSSTVNT